MAKRKEKSKEKDVIAEYDWSEMSEFGGKDEAISKAVGCGAHSAGSTIGDAPCTRDMQFTLPNKQDARAAVERLRAIPGVRAEVVTW